MSFEFLSNNCVKCAKCLATCSIYSQKKDEVHSPRGFITLLASLDKGVNLSKDIEEIFNTCLLCANCSKACPQNLRVDFGICLARSKYKSKIKGVKRLILALLANKSALDILAFFGFVLSTCLAKKQNGLALPLIYKKLIPWQNKRSFINKNQAFISFGGQKNIGFFAGCFINYFYQDTGEAFLQIASKLKLNTDIMKGQSCCGSAHFFSGDYKTAIKLAKKNIAYFEQVLTKCEAILIPEATCCAMIKEDYQLLLENEPSWAKRAAKISPKIHLASKWLLENTRLKSMQKPTKSKLAYHDPCHAKNILGIHKEPRLLLAKSFDLVPIKEGCCAFGGLNTQLSSPKYSQNLALEKCKSVQSTGAKILSSECHACCMQLGNALFSMDKNSDILITHPLNLLAKNLEENE